MDLETFTRSNAPQEGGGRFQLENGKLLDVVVDDPVMAKVGTMVANTGDVSFTGKTNAEGGITGYIKEKATSEGTPLMQAKGSGHLYLADQAKDVQALDLDAGEEISVNGEDVLAFERSVDYEISTIGSLSGAAAGGLTNVFLSGPGSVAITTHGEPIVLGPPVRTDPNATVAWSSNCSPSIHSDRSLGDMIGRSSGETYQMEFTANQGFVVVQPFEEVSPAEQR